MVKENRNIKKYIYWIVLVTPIRGTRPSTTSTTSPTPSTNPEIIAILSNDKSTVFTEPKSAALVSNDGQRQSKII